MGYTLNMKTSYYNQVKQLSPYPVDENNTDSRYMGSFWWGKTGDNRPYADKNFKPYISISPLIKRDADKTATLVHELGHALHYRRHCKCYTTNNSELRELHAYRFTMRFMLRYKMRAALRSEIKWLRSKSLHGFYLDASRQLQTEKIWFKCLEFLGL